MNKIRLLKITFLILFLIGLMSLSYYLGTKNKSEEKVLVNYDSTQIKKDTLKKINTVKVADTIRTKNSDREYYDIDGMKLSEYEYKEYLEKKNFNDNKEFAEKLIDFYHSSGLYKEHMFYYGNSLENLISKFRNKKNDLKNIVFKSTNINSNNKDMLLLNVKNEMIDYLNLWVEQVLKIIDKLEINPDGNNELRSGLDLNQKRNNIDNYFNKIIKKYNFY